MDKASDNITIQQDTWTWRQQYNVKNMVLAITMTILIAIINTVDYTKMPSSLYGNNVEHINDSRETSGITFKIVHAISL